jgi:site-specific recombinase XerD
MDCRKSVCYSGFMEMQLCLFKRKSFPVVITQGSEVVVPKPGGSVHSTLGAYNAYLSSMGYSPYTLADFLGVLKKFGLYVGQKPLGEITTEDVRQWVGVLRSRERVGDKTIGCMLSALNNYFTWLVMEKAIDTNPAMAIPNGKITSPLPEILFDAEMKRLLEVASRDTRSYFLVLMLLETGVKIEELMDLQLVHIDTSNPYAPEIWIKHTGKKIKKDRKLKLPREVVPVLADYVEQNKVTDRLFPITQRMVRYILASVGESAGLQKRVSAQLLRDTCAIRWLRLGELVETVLLKLGLSETTWEDAREKYLKLMSQAL